MKRILSHLFLILIFLLSAFTDHAQKCGVLTFTVTELADIVTGTDCRAHFKADATFNSTAPDYACSCCEFRQRVKGKFLKDGNKVDHKLLGPVGPGPHSDYLPTGTSTTPTNMSETDYMEDYVNYGNGSLRYGHRNEPNTANDNYTKGGGGTDANTPDPAGGCTYTMTDRPGFSNCQTGHTYKVDLYFEDKIITTCELCDGCRTIETHVTAERTVPSQTGGGIGPDFTSLLVFFLLTAGWILLSVRKRLRVA